MYKLSEQNLVEILEIARFAPSVHNTQPWRVSIDDGRILVDLDEDYVLEAGDPTGRETIISMGIFTESVILSARNFGLSCERVVYSDKKVTISFEKGKKTSQDIHLLKSRATDRSIYKKVKIAKETTDKLASLSSDNVKIWVVTDEEQINKIAKFTSQGISLALANPEFRRELGQFLIRPGSNKKRGISTESLYLNPILSKLQPELVPTGIFNSREAKLEKKRWESASADLIITTPGDLEKDWFLAGRTYLRLSLEIERFGLAQATSAAVVEASTYHEDVEEMLGTSDRILALIRIGKSDKKRKFSPRVNAHELIS